MADLVERVAQGIWEAPILFHGEETRRISWASLLALANEGDAYAAQHITETRSAARAAIRETIEHLAAGLRDATPYRSAQREKWADWLLYQAKGLDNG